MATDNRRDDLAKTTGGGTVVLLMLKAPRPGTVKTRLAAEVGAEYATRIYRALVERQWAGLPREWRCEVHFAPADAEAEMRVWLGDKPKLVAQAQGDLGARLAAAVAQVFAGGATRVLVIGGDCPGLDESTLRAAEAALHRHDVVLGPASDGGYYLIGLASARRELFDGIPWSTEHVLEATLRRAQQAGLSVASLPMLDDVDTRADWRRSADAFPDLLRHVEADAESDRTQSGRS